MIERRPVQARKAVTSPRFSASNAIPNSWVELSETLRQTWSGLS